MADGNEQEASLLQGHGCVFQKRHEVGLPSLPSQETAGLQLRKRMGRVVLQLGFTPDRNEHG